MPRREFISRRLIISAIWPALKTTPVTSSSNWVAMGKLLSIWIGPDLDSLKLERGGPQRKLTKPARAFSWPRVVTLKLRRLLSQPLQRLKAEANIHYWR